MHRQSVGMMRDGLLRGGLTKNPCGMRQMDGRQMDGRQLMARATDSCHVCSLALLLCLVLS